MTRNLYTHAEQEIIKFASMHGEWTAYGVVSVLAARKLADEGVVVIVHDAADVDGIGKVVVRLGGVA